jgi:hypothetical protein
MKEISKNWFIDENGNYYYYLGAGSFKFYGKPEEESNVIRKILNGEISTEATPFTIKDGKKIYHVYNKKNGAHFDILVK